MSETLEKMPSTSAEEITAIVAQQRAFFETGKTRPLAFRKEQLKKLKWVLQKHEAEVLQALAMDIGKPPFEGFSSDVGLIYNEINFALANMYKWTKPKRVPSPIYTWPTSSYIEPQPKGNVLIIAPWNYPVNLALGPLVSAIAAGNTAVLKPSEQTPMVEALLHKLITENFDPGCIAVVRGSGITVVPELMLNHRFDHVFFTGSKAVGRKIAEMAAPKLTPITLELGGKSPCVVHKSANLKVAAKRIVFGKWFNVGQTCIAPDYLIIHESIKEDFTAELIRVIESFSESDIFQSEHFGKIVNKEKFERLERFMKDGKIIYGGKRDVENLKMEITLIGDLSLENDIMKDEIFGPLLPIFTFKHEEELFNILNANPDPLAFYVFARNTSWAKKLMHSRAFGNGAINNVLLQFSNKHLPFGGIGTSGYGTSHGKAGFDTFSQQKGLLRSATWLDPNLKYPPYSGFVYKFIRWLMR